MTESTGVLPEYVAARTVLLNALDALGTHRPALVVVGAQAVYLRTGTAGLTVAPYTTDGDVVLDPQTLPDAPLIDAVMEAAGFRIHTKEDGAIEPGTWVGETTIDGVDYEVPVDLIVPAAALPGGNTRGARLPVHGKRVAKRTHGLEAALVDHDVLVISGLAPADDRKAEVAVAGVAALLVAKIIKLRDRVKQDNQRRLNDKDAADVLRLVRATPVRIMAEQLRVIRGRDVATAVTSEAISELDGLFRSATSPGVVMATRAVALDLPADTVEAQLVPYMRELRTRLAE